MSQYLGYVGLVALSSVAGTGLTGVVAVQLGAAALAALALFDLGRQLCGRLAGMLAAAAFIIDFDIARWHAYILSDSLYISFVVIATWFIHRAAQRGWGAYAMAALAALVTASIRPNGWIFGPLCAVYWIGRSALGKWTRVAVACALLAGLGGIVSIVLYQRYGAVIVNPPRGWDNARAFADVWLGLFGYGPEGENRLAQSANRLLMELAHVRPQYSFRHNAIIVAVLAVTYPLAVAGFIRERRQPLSRWMLAVIAGHMAVVALTFADRDGRYLLYVFPLILVFAGCGAAALLARFPRSG